MAFKKVSTLDADVTITIGGEDKKTKKKNPTSVEGFYLGTRTVATNSKFGGDSTLYFFQTEKGNVGVWGKTDLNKKMSAAKPGQMTRIEYNGMKPMPKGDMHVYAVFQDSEVTIDVSELQESNDNVSDSTKESYTSYEYGDADEDDAEVDDTSAAAVQQESAAARKAKVQELVNRNRTK